MAKQVYLNVGNFLLGACTGPDAVPIEGFDAAILDEEFGLKEKRFHFSPGGGAGWASQCGRF